MSFLESIVTRFLNERPKKKAIKIGFRGFWDGFSLATFLDRHPYLCRKYSFTESQHPDYRFVSVFPDKTNTRYDLLNDAVNVFYSGENVEPSTDRFDYALSFSLTNHPNHYRLPCWVPRLYQNGMRPKDLLSTNRPQAVLSNIQPEFCNFIFRNRVDFREKFFYELNARKPVAAPGVSCNNSPSIGASVADKIAYQRNFRFSVAMENERSPGYTTEKIVEAFIAGTVPIYLGDPDIGDDFNLESFVNMVDVGDYARAVDRVLILDEDHRDYLRVRNAPVFRDDVVPEYAVEENIMSFFERIFG
jgi:hypothetical protein